MFQPWQRSQSHPPPQAVRGWLRGLTLALACVAVIASSAHTQAQEDREPPTDRELEEELPLHEHHAVPMEGAADAADDVQLAPLVQRLLDDPLTTEAERRRLAIFHGQWHTLDEQALADLTLEQQAQLALLRQELDHPALMHADAPPALRAEAALLRGEPERVLDLLAAEQSLAHDLLRAQAFEQLGRLDEAVRAFDPWRTMLEQGPGPGSASELVAAGEALAMLTRLEGRPAHEYGRMMNMLGRAHQQLDPLHWPAHLAEARILLDKDNTPQAVDALIESLRLNPRAGEAWYHLGRLAANHFDFERTAAALEKLREINPDHPLAAQLEAHVRLVERDPYAAQRIIQPLLDRYPAHREAIALQAAAAALRYDEPAMLAALARHDKLSPGHPAAYELVGRHLSRARQYELAEAMLREAIARQPNAPSPHVELGLLLMQSGHNEQAFDALRRATRLDPFHRRAANQLKLVESMLEFHTIETEHFVIRYRPGVDQVLARDMARWIEPMHAELVATFQHQPARKTQIDILPDEQWFGVRITGMPEIWTIGAATGPVIAITPPREGARQRGSFDWANVIRHEYVHTITLSQTHNRIPHWFTEACAVAEEMLARGYSTYRLLAWAHREGKLFELDAINWGFIRPREPYERSLAYAQGHWMHEYITQRFGQAAVVQLLDQYAKGAGNVEAIEQVTGTDGATFMSDFRAWAGGQVQAWGMGEHPGDGQLEALLDDGEADGLDADQLQALLTDHPDHPELLRLQAERAMRRASGADAVAGAGEQGPDAVDPPQPLEPAQRRDVHAVAAARQAVRRYAHARPVDPWSHRMLATLAIENGQARDALASMEQLDNLETRRGDWAHQLAQTYRALGQLDDAADAAARALRREPYNATYRELAATIALQRGDTAEGLYQLQALALLEPRHALHHVRLAALHHQLGEPDEARAAARRARELNADAPVQRFLGE